MLKYNIFWKMKIKPLWESKATTVGTYLSKLFYYFYCCYHNLLILFLIIAISSCVLYNSQPNHISSLWRCFNVMGEIFTNFNNRCKQKAQNFITMNFDVWYEWMIWNLNAWEIELFYFCILTINSILNQLVIV